MENQESPIPTHCIVDACKEPVTRRMKQHEIRPEDIAGARRHPCGNESYIHYTNGLLVKLTRNQKHDYSPAGPAAAQRLDN